MIKDFIINGKSLIRSVCFDSDTSLSISQEEKTIKKEVFDESLVKLVAESPERKLQSLVSPQKFPRIPRTPHRPSSDAFWQQEIINDWNDEFSPIKKLKSKPKNINKECKEQEEKLLSKSKPSKTSTIRDKAAKDNKKIFHEKKNAIAESFLSELDSKITQGRISKLAASAGGVRIRWNKKLNTTAGRANWRREFIKPETSLPESVSDAVTVKHYATIELAEKVIDDEDRLLNVVAHEFCHLANFMISNIRNNPHGKEFKAWAAKCTQQFGHRGVHVTTRHNYSIEYKYIWECENCAIKVQRHSKSVDPVRHRCGNCSSKLVQIKPVPRTGTKDCEYQKFIRENLKKIREDNPGSPQKEIMGMMGKKYQEYKALRSKVGNENPVDLEVKDSPVSDVGLLVSRLEFIDLTSP